MAEKLKQNIALVCCAALGVLNFIFFAIPYLSGVNAYDILSYAWDWGFSGVMCALIQLLALLGTIAMLVIGGVGLVLLLTNKTCSVDLKKFAKLALAVMTVLSVLMLVFLIILIIDSFVSLSAGSFISIVFTAGSLAAVMLLEKKA